MSVLERSLARALGAGTPMVRPKPGAITRREAGEAGTLRRTGDEDEARTLRRTEDEQEEARTLRRRETNEDGAALARRRTEDEGEGEVQARRQEDGNEDEEQDAQALRREEGDDDVQTLRRMEEDGEEVQARRAAEDEDEPVRPLLRRAGEGEESEDELQPMPRELDPEHAPPGSELVDAEAPPELRARRAEAPDSALAPSEPAAPSARGVADARTGYGNPVTLDASEPAEVAPPVSVAGQPPNRPHVSIDQIDVVIHEDGGSSGRADGTPTDFARAVRARYLRGL